MREALAHINEYLHDHSMIAKDAELLNDGPPAADTDPHIMYEIPAMELNIYSKLWHGVKQHLRTKGGDLTVSPNAFPPQYPFEYATTARRMEKMRDDAAHHPDTARIEKEKEEEQLQRTRYRGDARQAASERLLACHSIDDYDLCPTSA